MSRRSRSNSPSNNSSRSSSGGVSIHSVDSDVPDITNEIGRLACKLLGHDAKLEEHSSAVRDTIHLITGQMTHLLRLLESEIAFPNLKDVHSNSKPTIRHRNHVSLGRPMAKGWIKKLNRAWSSNAEMHSHLSRFKEIYPGWDPKDSDRLAQIGDIVDRGVFSVLQDMRELVNDRPDPLDEEYVYVNDFEPVNPFLTDDEAGSSDEESESSECKKGSSTNETTDGGASFDDAVDQLHISQLRITDSDSDSDSDWD